MKRNRNSLRLTSNGDLYAGNRYGVQVQSALITRDLAAPSSGNTTRIDLFGGTFEGNLQHLAATASTDLRPGGGMVGTENTVELLIRNTASSTDAIFAICGGSPTEPSNRVTLIGFGTAFDSANNGVFFEEWPWS